MDAFRAEDGNNGEIGAWVEDGLVKVNVAEVWFSADDTASTVSLSPRQAAELGKWLLAASTEIAPA